MERLRVGRVLGLRRRLRFRYSMLFNFKILLEMKSVGKTGEVEFYEPFVSNIYYVRECWPLCLHCRSFKIPFPGYAHYDESRGNILPLGAKRLRSQKNGFVYLSCFIDSSLDWLRLAMFGLMHVDVSIYQMLRGGSIVFVAC